MRTLPSPEVIYEDNHLLAVRKPSGWLVQGDQTGDECLADWGKRYLKEKYQKPGAVFCGVIHRIDRPVSGLVVMAKTGKALSRMNALFKERETEKIYIALVEGMPKVESGTLIHFLRKDEKKNKAFVKTNPFEGGLKCVLSFELMETDGKQSRLKVIPETGRPHQIRAQLSAMRCPIVGDVKYGASGPLPDQSIRLHAYSLSFVHPVKQTPIKLVAECGW